jgi:hypothetical protein
MAVVWLKVSQARGGLAVAARRAAIPVVPGSDLYKDVGDAGLRVGGYFTLGSAAALVVAATAKSVFQVASASYSEWIAYGGAIGAVFAFAYEVWRALG